MSHVLMKYVLINMLRELGDESQNNGGIATWNLSLFEFV